MIQDPDPDHQNPGRQATAIVIGGTIIIIITTITTTAALMAAQIPVTREEMIKLFNSRMDRQDSTNGLDIDKLEEGEVKGRWKSFLGKWNRGELDGWYETRLAGEQRRGSQTEKVDVMVKTGDADTEEDNDEFGPTLPGQRGQKQGVAVPGLVDLEIRAEQAVDEREMRRLERAAERKVERKVVKERLEELVPRAEAGTRERMLEKRREVNEKMKGFRDKSPGGDEVADEELVGGAGGGVEEYKRLLEREKQRTSERQVRRDEIARAKAAEREERVRAYREREEETVGRLRELAKLRFG
ncbi:hypothetical protein OQA88_9652 [Cercophora sp. LCS_1]